MYQTSLRTHFASFWTLEKNLTKNEDNQNLSLIELIIMVYRILLRYHYFLNINCHKNVFFLQTVKLFVVRGQGMKRKKKGKKRQLLC